MFAVVDVETTGGHASGHGMTEIAIVLTDGREITGEYTTLLNPQQAIPLSIQTLTGITPEMVREAPRFEEVAGEIRDFLGDHVFVAHHVNFDFSFVKEALASCGIAYQPRRMCSVRYARKTEAGLASYSLKNLCRHFGIHNEAPHRALGDARATTALLHLLLERDKGQQWRELVKKNSGEFNLPAHVPSEDYHTLPEAPGVYYFLDQAGKPLYIGKARNLKKRVATHFITQKETRRSQAFKREIYHIDFELTGSELLAILLEDHEIRHHWPKYNRAQKNPKKRFGVFSYQSQGGAWTLAINRITVQKGYIAEFYSYHEALNWLYRQVTKYGLDPSRCGLPGAGTEATARIHEGSHNAHFKRMMESLPGRAQSSYIIKTCGRNEKEDGFAYVEKGRFAGIGFVPCENEIRNVQEVLDYLRELRGSMTTHHIIDRAILNEKYETIELS